jgi:hypothetical protein
MINKLVALGAALALVGGATQPAAAQSWDGSPSGKIANIDASDGYNYAFRVYIGVRMCGNDSPYWAYMNIDFNNYQATAALLTAAWLSGKTVTIFSNKDAVGNCKIGYVSFSG